MVGINRIRLKTILGIIGEIKETCVRVKYIQ